jgi:FAD/FMN-containing dehydrogenase
VPDLAGVLRLFREARRGPFVLSAFEFFTDVCLERVKKHRKLTSPFAEAHGCYVVLEAEKGDAEATEAWLTRLFEEGLVADGTMAQHATQAAQLWELRESISESLSGTGLPHKNDIALPSRCSSPSAPTSNHSSRRTTQAGKCASSATSATATCTSTS